MSETSLNEFALLLLKREDRMYEALTEFKNEIKTAIVETKEVLRAEIAQVKEELRTEFRTALAETKEELRTEFRTALAKTKDEILSEVGDFIAEHITTEVVHINEFKKLDKRVIAVERVVFPEGYAAVKEDSEEYNAE